ncbi:Gfo/Idh/MocA family protein [Fimbriiglobus ruber]|uniref:Dehydrogenase n=1 Tax=Fimbriiglobus ruber TaxID=1908690 RepID=A0A225EAX3_9BACT|nr:Gfo/Idh/MocA family oxidoreductase [Fimbriiglobus ruber]OWK47186.1 dehydrogenase [Fimbriiglobus ruber]
MQPITRRQFAQSATALTLSAASYTRAADAPNETVRVVVMGTRIRGKFHLSAFPSEPHVEVTHVIEPDSNLVPDALGVAAKHQKAVPTVETDVRKVLEDKSVDVLVVAAPDHWHALATVWACQAGKHVYVEKPVSHNIIEGRRMVQAARKYKRVVQAGMQRRSAGHVDAAREFVQSGKLGKVPFARAWIAGNRSGIGKKANAPVPKGVDYSLWLGPAKESEFNPNHFHYNWHWFWEYGTGEIGNNGIHMLDVARNILNLDSPTRISSSGGIYFYDDDRETPDTHLATFDFPNCSLVWEHRIWAKTGLDGEAFGVSIHGEKGTLVFDSKGWHVKDVKDGLTETSEKGSNGIENAHVRNFLACIKSGKLPNADIEIGHKSTRLCHLGNIAYRTGRTLKFDAETETITGDADANKLLGREYRKGFELPTV